MVRSTARSLPASSWCCVEHWCCASANRTAPRARTRMSEFPTIAHRNFDVPPESAGQRLDQFVTASLGAEGVSRSRVQLLLDQGAVLVNSKGEKASYRLRGGEHIAITGNPHPAPLKAIPEDIPLDVVFEDGDLA